LASAAGDPGRAADGGKLHHLWLTADETVQMINLWLLETKMKVSGRKLCLGRA